MEATQFFSMSQLLSILPLSSLGFITFVFIVLADILSPRKKVKSYKYYIQEFLYACVSIALGIAVCYSFEFNISVTKAIVILMGIFGSTIIRRIGARKQKIADDVVDKIEEKIKSK